jgi:hypothetical protein
MFKSILAFSFLLSSVAFASDVTVTSELGSKAPLAGLAAAASSSANEWVNTDRICFSHGSDRRIAEKSCVDAAETMNLLSNDSIIFQANCNYNYESFCRNYYAAILSVKVLVLK